MPAQVKTYKFHDNKGTVLKLSKARDAITEVHE